MVKEVKIATLL